MSSLTSRSAWKDPRHQIISSVHFVAKRLRLVCDTAALTALAITLVRFGDIHAAGHLNLELEIALAWNLCRRFVVFEIFGLLLDRIRAELPTRHRAGNLSAPVESPKA